MAGNKEHGDSGWVFNIQRYAVHDGPGIRTTIFLKGCPLHCLWCSNPESQHVKPQFDFWEERCIHCDNCVMVCPQLAVSEDDQGWKHIDPRQCDFCGLCIDQCYADALEQIGKSRTFREILDIVEEDRAFYDESGGGMTLSGGEPLTQARFAFNLLKGAQERGIRTAIETSGYAPWSVWEDLLPYLDLILFDLKEIDPKRHAHFTGVSNELILDNFKRLAKADTPIIVRRPVIPGYNDTPESIHALGNFVRRCETVNEIDLLPYHRLGQEKYKRLGQEYALGDTPTMKDEDVTGLYNILLSYGLNVKIGG